MSMSAMAQRPVPRPRPVPPTAQDRFPLLINQEFRGASTIPLKVELKKQYPHLHLQSMQIKSVTVLAKSRMGRGTISLSVGPDSTYTQTVGQGLGDYRD